MSQKSAYAFGLVVLAIVVALSFYFWHSIGPDGGAETFPISWFMIVAAVTGAVVNEPFRSSELGNASKSVVIGYLLWKSAVSIVFAFVIYMLFIAGLVSGDMFPKFVKTTLDEGGEFTNMKDFATVVDPATNKDVAKILVWSFVAGYSEKFVPNLVNQLTHGVSQKEQKTDS